ncbi:MAG: ATP-binding protein [Pseudomonadota bacterium]
MALLDTSPGGADAFIDALPWSVVIWHADGTTVANDRFVAMFGNHDPATLPMVLPSGMAAPWRPEGPEEEQVTLDDGRHIGVHRSPTPDGGVLTVQTELKGASSTAAQARSQGHLVSIIENISDGVLLIDADGALIEYNRRLLSLYGIDHRQVRRGMPYDEFLLLCGDLDALDPARRRQEIERRRAFALDPARRFTLRQLFTGETLEINKEITPDQAAVITVRDITETLRQARALEEERRRDRDAIQHKSRFMARMSHEMRTPLNGVLGVSALLERSNLNPQQRAMLGAIRDSGSVLLRLIDDLLESTRLDTVDFELQARPFLVCDVVREAVQIIEPEAHRRALRIDRRPAASKLPLVVGDAVRLKQVLLNLLSNAVKFTDEGSIAVGLSGRVVGPGARVSLYVSDTGIGIAEADFTRIFEQFEQLNPERSRLSGGVGLGLSISKRLVEAMGGTLAVSSAPGRGSRFTIDMVLPLAGETAA